MGKWNMKSKRWLLALVPATILFFVGVRTIVEWDADLFVKVAPWCLGYMATYSGIDSKWPSGQNLTE